MENVWLSLMSKDRWSTSHWAFNLVGVRFCNDYQPWSIVSSFQIQRTAPIYQAFLYYAVIRKIFVLCHNSTIVGFFLRAPRNDIFSCFPACARHVPTKYCVLTLENCDFEIAWKFVKANLSWCLSFLHSASYISWSLVSSLLSQIWQEILISALVLQFAASVVWIKCILCLYVNAQAFVNIQRHMAAPRLIQNVWPGFLWISQRSIMQKIPTFGPHPSCCLLPWQRIFSWPTVHPHLSGIWCARCCRGTEHDFSPNCSVLWLRSIVFAPELLIKAGNCAQQEPFVCAQVALCMNLLFTFLFVEDMSSKCIFKPSVWLNEGWWCVAQAS